MSRIVVIEEDLDAAAVAAIKPLLEELSVAEEDVILDLSGVDFIDSSGVGAIVFLYKRLRSRNFLLLLREPKGQPLGLLSHLRMMDLVEGKIDGKIDGKSEGKRAAGEAA